MTEPADSQPQLVAHRGYPSRYPENTLLGMRAAIEAGAKMIEFDVQMSADQKLVVLHDDSLQRTAGVSQSVFDMTLDVLQQTSVHEPARFGERYYPETIPSLAQMLDLIAAHSDVAACVEIKAESIEYFSLSVVMDAVITALLPYANQCVVISFSDAAIEYTQRHSELRTGWVLEKYNQQHHQRAQSLQPDILICNQRKVMRERQLWPGSWQWMLYGVETPELVEASAQRGAAFVESDCIGDLLAALQKRQAE